jgi:hypothetical protein
MDMPEIGWRARTLGRIAIDRSRQLVVPSRWNRRALLDALAPLPELNEARRALADTRWHDADRELARHFASTAPRFVIAASSKPWVVASIRRACPDSPRRTAAQADRIVSGRYDLLGYRGLMFDPPDQPGMPDWHSDPVHRSSAPRSFWSSVR